MGYFNQAGKSSGSFNSSIDIELPWTWAWAELLGWPAWSERSIWSSKPSEFPNTIKDTSVVSMYQYMLVQPVVFSTHLGSPGWVLCSAFIHTVLDTRVHKHSKWRSTIKYSRTAWREQVYRTKRTFNVTGKVASSCDNHVEWEQEHCFFLKLFRWGHFSILIIPMRWATLPSKRLHIADLVVTPCSVHAHILIKPIVTKYDY